MKTEKYYVGLDIGTDSVGYAVTNEQYDLCKFKGDAMWGTTLFDSASLAVERRGFRTARRRLDRRQQRVRLIGELFAPDIAKVDEDFFKRIKESYLYPETLEEKIRLFDTWEKQKEYCERYPTIHHLLVELMNDDQPHDVRLVYLACAWLVAHRGHFLSEVDRNNVEAVTNFDCVYDRLVNFICQEEDNALPWDEAVGREAIARVLQSRVGIKDKSKELMAALFGKNKLANCAFQYKHVIDLLCGGTVDLKNLFDNEEYAALGKVALNMEDEKLAEIMVALGDDAALITALKEVYDWSVLVNVLNGEKTISDAKVKTYEQHKEDLKTLKFFVKKYIPNKYNEIFRLAEKEDENKKKKEIKINYVAYVGKTKTVCQKKKPQKSVTKSEFCNSLQILFKSVTPDETDAERYHNMIERLSEGSFLPKQVDGDNRVIPYQLYWYELNKILENAKAYLPFLSESDAEGVSGAEKVLSVFTFRVPYYVGPLKEKSNPKWNHWMVRRAEGQIYPWNFEKMVDLDASEDAFIARMTNSCTYIPGEDVLPKNSLVYSAFEVLNEINNIKINGNDIPVCIKQEIYNKIFLEYKKVTPKKIAEYLISNNYMQESDVLSGLDITVKSSLSPYVQFRHLMSEDQQLLAPSSVEEIIRRAAYSEDKGRFSRWLKENYPHLPDGEISYIAGLKLKNFGRLSRRFLCGIEGASKESGEAYASILHAMWDTNCNLMQLLSDRFTFSESIAALVQEYYADTPMSLSDRLEEMRVSNAVKRPIIRALDIMHDVVKAQKHAPERIFIEMARDTGDANKGKRTQSRDKQIEALYKKVKGEDVRDMSERLKQLGEHKDSVLQSDKLFLYFMQLGKCLYTKEPIDFSALRAGDGTYNIEHIYPRSRVKDDSIVNNEILVVSTVNGQKKDTYPIDRQIQERMRRYWTELHSVGLISDEKFKRLTRTTPFTEEERFAFIIASLLKQDSPPRHWQHC